jgi:hypothetical protein
MKALKIAAVGLAVVTCLALVVSCGSEDGAKTFVARPVKQPIVVPGLKAVSDLTGALPPGAFPRIAVSGRSVVAISDSDFSAGWKAAGLALSNDGGASWRTIGVDGPVTELTAIEVVIDDDSILVVGSQCDDPGPPDPGNLEGDQPECAGDGMHMPVRAYLIDLDDDHVQPLPSPADPGTRIRSLGVVDGHPTFVAAGSGVPKLLTWDDGWSGRNLPAKTKAMTACATSDQIVAVWSLVSGDPALSPDVEPGTPLWAASVSTDDGRTWSEASVYASQAKHDGLPITPKIDCGPDGVLVSSAQLAAFGYEQRTWRLVPLPAALTGRSMFTDAAWLGPGTARLWVDQVVDISNAFDGTPRVTVGEAAAISDGGIGPTFGGGGPANDLVLVHTRTSTYLGRTKL